MATELDNPTTCAIPSPIGYLEITSTDFVISRIHFTDETSFGPPASSLQMQAAAQLSEYFEGRRQIFDLPIQQQGSAFQQKVWQQLLLIPFGKTVSYMQMARWLGDAKTIRAAASANGKNDIAIVVPCHRVIGSDGSLTGYAGGLYRKQWLLQHERFVSGKTTQASLF